MKIKTVISIFVCDKTLNFDETESETPLIKEKSPRSHIFEVHALILTLHNASIKLGWEEWRKVVMMRPEAVAAFGRLVAGLPPSFREIFSPSHLQLGLNELIKGRVRPRPWPHWHLLSP